jgi:hypothetical protein
MINYQKIIYNLFITFILSLVIFSLYVELNPKITNILFVKTSKEYKIIEFTNLINLIIGPFKYDFYWLPSYLDVNYIVYFIVVFIFVECYDSILNISS